MRYIEVIIETPENEIDERCEKLTEMGISGFVIENESDFKEFLENNRQYWDYVDEELEQSYAGVSRIKCYLEDNEDGKQQLNKIQELYNAKVGYIDNSDWENEWKKYYEPLEIGEKFLVVPEWKDAEAEGRVNLRLDPGLMFGTGSHATTRMCLSALEKYAEPGKKVLDLGCGSGILGIGALILGADFCVGCDIDPKAPDIVMANAALNGIGDDRLKVYAGDIVSDAAIRKMLGTGYDIVLANIVSDVIIALAPYIRGFMSENGVFISSGIIDGREDEVRTALESAGFKIRTHHHEDDWHLFNAY